MPPAPLGFLSELRLKTEHLCRAAEQAASSFSEKEENFAEREERESFLVASCALLGEALDAAFQKECLSEAGLGMRVEEAWRLLFGCAETLRGLCREPQSQQFYAERLALLFKTHLLPFKFCSSVQSENAASSKVTSTSAPGPLSEGFFALCSKIRSWVDDVLIEVVSRVGELFSTQSQERLRREVSELSLLKQIASLGGISGGFLLCN